jgi:hypothetical protein
MSCLQSVFGVILLTLLATSARAASGDFKLRNLEVPKLFVNVEGGTAAAGKALVADTVNTLIFYEDGQSRLRTRNGDFCIGIQGGYLKLVKCTASAAGWRYSASTVFHSIVSPDSSQFATWEIVDKHVFIGRKFVARTDGDKKSLQQSYGAAWKKKNAS